MPLYDARGNLIPPRVQDDQPKPLPDTPSQGLRQEPPQLPVEKVTPFWQKILKWIGLPSFAALVFWAYDHRPMFVMVSIADSDRHGSNGVKAIMTNNGFKVAEADIQCFSNKVTFVGDKTLSFHNAVLLNASRMPEIGTGEQFTADCNFVWSLWTNTKEGVFLYGQGGGPSNEKPGLAYFFKLRPDGLPDFQGINNPTAITTNFVDFQPNEVTAIDGTFTISYNWKYAPFLHCKRVIRFKGVRDNGGLKWRPVPESDPPIEDSTSLEGFNVTVTGEGKSPGIQLKRMSP